MIFNMTAAGLILNVQTIPTLPSLEALSFGIELPAGRLIRHFIYRTFSKDDGFNERGSISTGYAIWILAFVIELTFGF
ncbi:MAG: hypothetical protein A3E37_01040 [Candidatus Andersenbacteria bacterium RIFCSPHIGHO2_12_FULL_46_9]|nr:MAG: hypothetical protein A3B76_04185 [Candidatus Andersenbacteria bacterium RIFCSPHIGHO2_02_FULL_46_16]OGY37696.1 MAG: hypothetical protein A3E37_01040 [Candidatus Andersenbacteria bacterium RIFCSPHIGHO2_12_FULL_46_9]OGY38286.1 MAG: hypothetical protein A3I08_03375 [Candidatus Andersenbacteria bacterium RIFCSPLOWO2_02_FULL_46_11]